MFKKVLIFVLIILLLYASRVFPWGAVIYWAPTHQAILRDAYKHLGRDPAFAGSGFLSLESILAQEGVEARTDMALNPDTSGPGPDAKGATPYSYHYFNPLTKEGMADYAVFTHFQQLIDPAKDGDKSKAAAWSAHFLADMSVPYHTVGMTSGQAIAYKNGNRAVLPEALTGPLSLYDNKAMGLMPPVGWGGRNHFGNAIVNFVDDHSGGDVDWFDPWYANGSGLRNSHESAASSHVLWEKSAHQKYMEHPFTGSIPNETGRYNPAWKNAAPNYNFNTNVMAAQAEQSAAFTQSAAMYTRNRIEAFHMNPHLGVYHAIRNVATLWRASITGLRPEIRYAYPAGPNGTPSIECRVRNAANAPAKNVRVKLFVIKNNQRVFEKIQDCGNILPAGTGSVKYRLLLEPDTEYDVVSAVVAQYDIPDLQLATVSGTIRTAPVRITPPPVRPDPVNPGNVRDRIRRSWEGSHRITSRHTSGKFKGSGRNSTFRVSFNERNMPSATFNGTPVEIRFINETTIVYFCVTINAVTTTLKKQMDGSIKGFFEGKHVDSGDPVAGEFSSSR